MNKLNFSNIFKTIKAGTMKHSPEILTGIGIAGMITTTILAVKATPKALRLIEEKKKDIFNNLDQEDIPGNNVDYTDISLKPLEVIKVAWKPYIPAVVTGVASVTCLIGASSVNAKRNAALATAYKLSETALNEYKEKVVETIGEKKEKSIKDAIAKDKVEKDPVNQQNIIVTGKGETLCYDGLFGRYFKSDMDKLKKIENDLNLRLRNENYISLNEFYYEVGLDGVGAGDDLGWNIERGYLELHFSSQLASDGTPCLVVGFDTPPRYDYAD